MEGEDGEFELGAGGLEAGVGLRFEVTIRLKEQQANCRVVDVQETSRAKGSGAVLPRP